MVPAGNHPILRHMRTYSHHGFKHFILGLGYKAEIINYFLNYPTMNSDFTIKLVPDIVRGCFGSDGEVTLRNPVSVRPWRHVLERLADYLEIA